MHFDNWPQKKFPLIEHSTPGNTLGASIIWRGAQATQWKNSSLNQVVVWRISQFKKRPLPSCVICLRACCLFVIAVWRFEFQKNRAALNMFRLFGSKKERKDGQASPEGLTKFVFGDFFLSRNPRYLRRESWMTFWAKCKSLILQEPAVQTTRRGRLLKVSLS